ncbi:MAG: PQQ-binding-like beta-propeller repeat protein [Tepidanaerobacteraceae bacterium]|jgi:outer membrane protein assembly factor BamB|nr:PQQ-binding-like beta-propeller repeat protein [Tepidanaerobacteraceae bacterium]
MRLQAITLGERVLKRQKPLMAGADVRNLQQILKWLGFFNFGIDGVFGYETESAVIMLQRALGIKPSGIVDEQLFDILHKMENGRALRWLTMQRDYCRTAHSPVPVPLDLKVAAKRRIKSVEGLCTFGDILIASARDGIYAMDLISLKTRWQNRSLSPASMPSIWDAALVVPAENLVILDLYSGKLMATVDADTFISPVAALEGIIIAPAGGSIYAVGEKGSALWRCKTEGALCSPPAAAYDLIYFASSDGNVYCVDKNGDVYWRTRANDIILEPVSIWNGRIFAVSRTSVFYAFNPLTGELIWKKKLSEREFLAPAFHKDFILAVDAEGEIFALSPGRAEIKWLKELNARPSAVPIICGDTAFFGTERGIAAIKVKTGEMRTFLENKKVTALIQARFGVAAAVGDELVVLSPDI